MLLQYVSLILLMFFITFFAGVFWKYIRTKTVVPQKMFSYKQGGLFEHYIIVGTLTVLIIFLHLAFDLSPFGENILNRVISILTLAGVGYAFLVFIFIFMFYLIAVIYTKIVKIEDRQAFFGRHNDRIVTTAMILSAILMVPVLIIGILQLLGVIGT
ncbi:MAG: hypothetical protein EA374_05000 [Acholeplasmatales bacterium]|nr:MAG: hypothetical protein EA374_05000 [Acholeplasmatales bacterium]